MRCSNARFGSLWSVLVVAAGLVAGCTGQVDPSIGRGSGSAAAGTMALRPEKAFRTHIDDPEAALFLTSSDLSIEASRACGLHSISYVDMDQATGPMHDSAANAMSRALLMWCRILKPKTPSDAVLAVDSGAGYHTLVRLNDQPLPVDDAYGDDVGRVYATARQIAEKLSGRSSPTQGALARALCEKTPVDWRYWPGKPIAPAETGFDDSAYGIDLDRDHQVSFRVHELALPDGRRLMMARIEFGYLIGGGRKYLCASTIAN